MKRCSKSFINREIQISMSIKCLFIPTLVTTMGKKKKQAGNSGIDLQTKVLLSLVWEPWKNPIFRNNKSIGLKGYEKFIYWRGYGETGTFLCC